MIFLDLDCNVDPKELAAIVPLRWGHLTPDEQADIVSTYLDYHNWELEGGYYTRLASGEVILVEDIIDH